MNELVKETELVCELVKRMVSLCLCTRFLDHILRLGERAVEFKGRKGLEGFFLNVGVRKGPFTEIQDLLTRSPKARESGSGWNGILDEGDVIVVLREGKPEVKYAIEVINKHSETPLP